MTTHRYSQDEITDFTHQVLRDGFCVLRDHFSPKLIDYWREKFEPLLAKYITAGGSTAGRGAERYYVTLPFIQPFADPMIYEDDDILAICEGLIGEDFVMCQLATDTPLIGSDFQDIHRDTPPLFPEAGIETPPYQLAINFPLVDVTELNGPIEIAPGTHLLSKEDRMRLIANGSIALQAVTMNRGDVMIRDVRGLHRGTPNRSQVPRPMVVIGYSRKWLFRPEVSIEIPRASYAELSERARRLLRYNPIVDVLRDKPQNESYDTFAY